MRNIKKTTCFFNFFNLNHIKNIKKIKKIKKTEGFGPVSYSELYFLIKIINFLK